MAVAERSRLKKWIYQTNDPDLLTRYYDRTFENLTVAEQDCMEKRISSAYNLDTLVSEIEARREELLIDMPVFGLRRAGNRTELVGVLSGQEENIMIPDDSVATAWQHLFQSRGVEFSVEELHGFSGEDYPGFVMRELVERVLPNTEAVSIRLSAYDNASDEERGELGRTEYEVNRVDMIRQTVRRAVQRWRSPVLLRVGDTAWTMVGLEGEDLICIEEGFLGIGSWTRGIDPETLIADGANAFQNIMMIYLKDRGSAE